MKLLRGFLALTMLFSLAYAQTSGKIMGTVTDEDGNPLPGANVIVEGTEYGAAANQEGYYVILNVPPGEYSVSASYVGYATVTQSGIQVEIDLTTQVNFALNPQAFQGETVTVVAERKVMRVDVASSQTNLGSEQIGDLPATSVEDVIGMQAGVSGLQVRQGGTDELAYMMDGVSMKDDRTGQPVSGVPLSSVQEIMIQSGGFNAEYSDLQAGVINIVTKEGHPEKYSFDGTFKYNSAGPKHHGMAINDPNAIYMRTWLDDDVSWWGTGRESYTDVNDNGYWDEGEPFSDRDGDGEFYNPWDEHIRKMYPAFDGWNQVASDRLANDDPSDDLTPTGLQQLFKWEHRRDVNIYEPDYNVDIGVGGPVPFIGKPLGNLRFYTSFRSEKNMYLVPLAREGYQEWSLSTKVTSDITQRLKLQLTGFFKKTEASSASETGLPSIFSSPIWGVAGAFGSSSQQRSKIFYPHYYCKTDIWSNVMSAKLTHQLSGRSYHESLIEFRNTEYFTGPDDPRDFTPRYNILPGTEGDDQHLVNEAPYGFDTDLTKSIDGFMMGAKSNARDSTNTYAVKARWDFISQVNQNNQIKTGAQFEYFSYSMNYGAINPALPAGRPWTKWEKSPWQIGAYIQDKLEFEGWIATVGLRAEYFNPNTDWYDYEPFDRTIKTVASREVTDEDDLKMKRAEGLFTLMPRIGISHPITVNSKLYFNYGHMRQRFSPDQLFGIRRVYGGSLSRLGNPELPMEKTIAYELGYDHSLFDQYLVHIAAYYKDKSDQATTVRYQGVGGIVNYYQYGNLLYQDIRGLEIELRKRIGDWLTGFVNYEYSVYSSGNFGVTSQNENPAVQRDTERNINLQKQYKPIALPRIKYNVAFKTPHYFGPEMGGLAPLANWQLAFTGTWRKGGYHTFGNNPNVVNNVRWVDSWGLDLRGAKSISFNNFRIQFVADVYNLLNRKTLSTAGLGDSYLVPGVYDLYQESLHFKEHVYEELGMSRITGDDKMGYYRDPGVPYQPLKYTSRATGLTQPDPRTYYFVGDIADLQALFPDDNITEDISDTERYVQIVDNEWTRVDKSTVQKVLDDKAYIFNPVNESFLFLAPRDIFFGIRISYDF
jgi:hypothetical protein